MLWRQNALEHTKALGPELHVRLPTAPHRAQLPSRSYSALAAAIADDVAAAIAESVALGR